MSRSRAGSRRSASWAWAPSPAHRSDSYGALDLVYGGTNVFSKITGQVQGGNGRATLASILNSQLIASGQPDSLSGVGGTPVASVLMHSFDLEAGRDHHPDPGRDLAGAPLDRHQHERPAPHAAPGPFVPRPAGERRQHRRRQ